MAAVSWKSAVSANWTVAADWSTGAVPASTDDVTIGVAGAYTVTLTTPAITVNSITVSDVNATLAVADPGGTDKVAVGFSNKGTVGVDVTGTGGTSVAIGGTLTNSGTLVIGNSGISKASTVTAAALANSGTIHLTGGSAQTALNITGAAPASLTGDYILQGDALVDFSKGGVTSIAGNSELVLDGAQSRVALGTATTTNSGLTGLTSNAGTLALQLGSKITTSGAFTNNGLIEVDSDIFGTGDAGGSGLTFGGALTNNGDLDIGNSGLTTATTVTAAGLSNAATGTIDLTGGTAQAALDITGAAPSTLTGFYFLQGDALLEFGGGHITAIAVNSELSLGGSTSRVALSSATTTNSALTLLASNSGILDLSGSAITTTTAFANRNQLSVDGGSKLTLGGALTNSGDASINSSSLTVGGTLTNSGDLQIDAFNVATQVTTGALSNTGTIDLSGGAVRATFDSTAAAPTTLMGSVNLDGNALMEFASGGVTTIATGASLALDGPRARVALSNTTTVSGALSELSKNMGSFALSDGATVVTTTGLTNSGTLSLDSFYYGSDFSNDGGSTLTIGGVLNNNGQVNVGNTDILAPTTITAAGLTNSGTINLTGASAGRSSLDSTAAAPATWTGTANLSGDALLEFASGGITAIASGADLSLTGATALVALSSALTTNSALTGLATNAGTLSLSNSPLTTTVALNNTGTLEVDYSYYAAGGGGSAVMVGGALSNSGSVEIGNSGITKATTVTAKGLANTGSIYLTGSTTARATLDSTAAAPAIWTGSIYMAGDALLEFASGGINAIGTGAEISRSGTQTLVALSTALTNNSALTGIASNAGTFAFANGAGLNTAGVFTNTGSLYIDESGTGGSVLNLGGALTNEDYVDVGNSTITAAATLTAKGLANSGSIYLTGGMAQAKLSITGAANNTDYINISNSVLSTTTGFTNSGSLYVDDFGAGGSTLTVGGTLTNNSGAIIYTGNTAITKATTVTAAGLSNTGTINLTGGSATKATLDITTAAPATWTGTADLSGDALLEFASGGVTAIGSGADLTLNGALALVALSTGLTTDSALTGLASNAGTLNLDNGALLTTTVGLTNSGTTEVDYFGSTGGSSMTIGGMLTNQSSLDIGNGGLTKATSVTAAALNNSSFINLNSGTAAATLKVTGAFGNTATVEVDSSFGGGGSALTIGGTLTNSGFSFNVGNTAITKATTVTAAGLSNTGTINLTGAAATKATLDITTAAPATWTGTANLSGDALLEFASGGVTAIGSGADLTLNGALALVALSTGLTTDSALTGLANNAGILNLENGALLTTTVGLTNSGTTEVDYFGSSGGSSLTIGGTLTNNSFSFDIGNGGLTKATSVTASALANTSSITLSGGTGANTATLTASGASTDSGYIYVDSGSILALGNTLTVSGSLYLEGGTVSGGTLATSGFGVMETIGSGTLSAVTIGAGSTFTVGAGNTLTVKGITVSGALSGSGATLDFASTGTDSLSNVSGFTTIGLASGAANTLTLATANFTGTSGVITVNDGKSGSTVSGSTLTSSDSITVHAGIGADTLTGGAGNDVFYAGGDTKMTGGTGTNQFIFSASGAATNTIADFGASTTNELVFSNSNFSLGLSGTTSTPQALTSSEVATLFTANSTGAFANTSQRLAYDTTNGELFSSTGGSGGTSHLVATLTSEPSINTANQLFFIS